MTRSATTLRIELLSHLVLVFKEAKSHGKAKMNEYTEKVNDLLLYQIGMTPEVANQYIDEAKKRI